MGKCLMLAVAGSGKTTYLIRLLNLEQRFLLVTYTRNNYEHLKRSVISSLERVAGTVPSGRSGFSACRQAG